MQLPELITKKEDESHKDFFERVYQFFWYDWIYFVDPFVENKKVILKKGKCQNKEYTFWHIVSNNEKYGPNAERCEYISWIRPMIENYQELIFWQNQRKTTFNLCIVDSDWRYLVVLREREKYYMLWTAYPLQGSRRLKLQKEYQNRKRLPKDAEAP